MCGRVQDCESSDAVLFFTGSWRIELPVLDRTPHLVKALHRSIERVVGFNIRHEDLAKQVKVFQIQSLAVSCNDVLDGQDIERVNICHYGRCYVECLSHNGKASRGYNLSPSGPRLREPDRVEKTIE